METEEKKLTSSEIDQMLEEAAAYHVESKEPSNKNKKNKKKKKKRKQIRHYHCHCFGSCSCSGSGFCN